MWILVSGKRWGFDLPQAKECQASWMSGIFMGEAASFKLEQAAQSKG